MGRTSGKEGQGCSLAAILPRLPQIHSFVNPPAGALGLILWENIGYLIDDRRRDELFGEFERRVGLNAAKIVRASDSLLLDIARRGGMRPETRVERWRRIAEIVLSECDGDLDSRLRNLPVARARTLLKRFPAIGDPGVDKILLFCGIDARPALESNGLRVVVRLGLVRPGASYAVTYRAATAHLARALPPDRNRLVASYLLLREHGRALCKRAAPDCVACPLDAFCAHAPAKGL
jgi:endonuclease-3